MTKPQTTYHFTPGFLWGTSTSSHQVEGDNNNNNWADWESQPGRIYHGEKAGRACEWWAGRWKEDFDRAQETGQNAHRLSLEWSRIQPTPDTWDEEAIERYRQMMRGLVERHLMPLVTLHHFTDPLWFVEQGGWESEKAPELFARYVRKIVPALSEYVTLWVTINEPNVFTQGGWLGGMFPPGKSDTKLAGMVFRNLLLAHAAAYKIIHEVQPHSRVGVAHQYRVFWPASGSPLDKFMANFVNTNFNLTFPSAIATGKYNYLFRTHAIPEAKGTQDFMGLNYYSADKVRFRLTKHKEFFHERYYPEDVELSETGFLANQPQAFFQAIKWANSFGLPILITENGTEDSTDRTRPSYLAEHIHQVWRAINFNWPVKGYFQWSLVDNFEWERGWSQRFGLWGLDLETQKRIRRPSVDFYEAVARNNMLSSEMVERYAPESFDRMFPV